MVFQILSDENHLEVLDAAQSELIFLGSNMGKSINLAKVREEDGP